MPELAAGIVRWVGLLGLMGLAGPAVLDGWILRGEAGPIAGPGHWRRSRALAVAGGLVLALGALAGALVAAWEVTGGRPEMLGRYLVATRTGRATLVQAAVGLAGAALAAAGWPRATTPGRWWILPGLAGAGALVWNSHAGIRGGSALLVDGVHVVAVAFWIGGLLRLALLDWRRLGELAGPRAPATGLATPGGAAAPPGAGPVPGRPDAGPPGGSRPRLHPSGPAEHRAPAVLALLPPLIRRFSNLGAVAVLLVATSGILAARRNLYGADALLRSPYGQALLVKLLLVAVVLAIAAVNLFALRPWLERRAAAGGYGEGSSGDGSSGGGGGVHRLQAGGPGPVVAVVRRLVRAEALAALAVLLASGILAVLPPADRPAAATEPVTWRVQVAGVPVELALEPGGRGEVTLSARSLGQAALARGAVRLDMPEHPMGLYQVTLSPPAGRANGTLEARAVLPMPGAWQLTWTLALADGRQETAVTTFEAAGAPGNQRQGRLSLRAAYQSTAGAVQATVALLGLLEAAVLVVLGWRRLWPIPFAAGLIALAAGAWLLGQVAWIDAYPTTDVPNPLPSTPAVIERGRQVFATHCAACHGPEGRGDGPAAAGMLPPPADLTGVHTRQHTDGDLYWWITHGIDGTAMPAFGDVLTEEDRWAVIRFIRQLGR
ncbi:c-type cytochrome [Thermaerobacter subterraneus]|uniref:Copper export protein n=1 Tax=Thermaerobacter subterraneus DSM 13965 TaxID=867903 RepID=K6Q299_9FIRM|nr:c-type cytochrome [Thermaerobacter subterraneus]EKP95114.1 putative copper export protein [Thermaerobacter subterraneus DSM 13965]